MSEICYNISRLSPLKAVERQEDLRLRRIGARECTTEWSYGLGRSHAICGGAHGPRTVYRWAMGGATAKVGACSTVRERTPKVDCGREEWLDSRTLQEADKAAVASSAGV